MLLTKSPAYKKTNDLVIPQPGHGKPVSILNGQIDWSVSMCPILLTIIKYGIASMRIVPAIP